MPGSEQPARYRVTGAMVVVPVDNPGFGRRMTHVGAGAFLPDGVEPDRIAHLLRHHLIEPVDQAAA